MTCSVSSVHYILDLDNLKPRSGLFAMRLGGFFTSTAVFSGRFGGETGPETPRDYHSPLPE